MRPSVVVLTELAKLGLALALYRYYDGTWLQLGRGTVAAWRLLLKYMVPAGLYAVYNNLMYINLTNFDPGTYTLMMQLRILFTGLLYQALFSRCAARRASDPRAASAAHGPRRLLTHAIHSRRSTSTATSGSRSCSSRSAASPKKHQSSTPTRVARRCSPRTPEGCARHCRTPLPSLTRPRRSSRCRREAAGRRGGVAAAGGADALLDLRR